jgi:mRNA interferase MazF
LEIPTELERGQIYWLDWHPSRGSEQSGTRPGLIVQTNIPNHIERYPLTIVVAVTSALKNYLSSVAIAPSTSNGLSQPSEVLCNQIQTVSKDRLLGYIGRLDQSEMQQVDEKLRYILALSR